MEGPTRYLRMWTRALCPLQPTVEMTTGVRYLVVMRCTGKIRAKSSSRTTEPTSQIAHTTVKRTYAALDAARRSLLRRDIARFANRQMERDALFMSDALSSPGTPYTPGLSSFLSIRKESLDHSPHSPLHAGSFSSHHSDEDIGGEAHRNPFPHWLEDGNIRRMPRAALQFCASGVLITVPDHCELSAASQYLRAAQTSKISRLPTEVHRPTSLAGCGGSERVSHLSLTAKITLPNPKP
eukprot:504786-Rhodomonas_salina.1